MRLDERGKQCPLPVIETKKALEGAAPGTWVEVLADNEIAVQNLEKMAKHKGFSFQWEKLQEGEYLVRIQAGEAGKAPEQEAVSKAEEENAQEACEECTSDGIRRGTIVVLSSGTMGNGDGDLGRLLMKGFVYALTQQDFLPETILLYNGGAFLSCEGSDSLEDLKEMEEQGVEILTCGTCLNHYGLSDRLAVGSVTNMYEIVNKMTGARTIVRP